MEGMKFMFTKPVRRKNPHLQFAHGQKPAKRKMIYIHITKQGFLFVCCTKKMLLFMIFRN